MLIILSDIHLADGSTSTNVSAEAFQILGKEIELNAKENQVQDIHIVLLGDIYDLVRTDWWFKDANVTKGNRPWNGDIDPATGMNKNIQDVDRQFNAVLDNIVLQPEPKAFVDMIKNLALLYPNHLQLTYVIGNHDRVLNNLPSLQKKISGLFPVTVSFGDSINAPEYGLFARHGHEWDDNCNARLLLQEVLQPKTEWKRLDKAINKVMAIGEVITAELMSGLVFEVRKAGDPTLADIIKRVDSLRPATSVFGWLDWEARSRSLTTTQKKIIVAAVTKAISGVVDSSLGRKWDDIQWDWIVSGDITDRLTLARGLLKAGGFDGLRDCVKLFSAFASDDGKSGRDEDECYEGAKEEIGSKPDNIQFIVYGHTHKARHDYFAGYPENRVRMYINTGTYLPLLEQTDDRWSFAQAYRMTMAFFYKDGEDDNAAGRGPSLDLWNGIKRKQYA